MPMILFTQAIVGIALTTSVLIQGSPETTGAAALQGTWDISSLNGRPLPEGTPQLTLTFAGDKYHQAVGGEVNERGTFTVDASQKPMIVDFTITEGDDAGKKQLGVIEVSGESLRASLSTPGVATRPADFTVKDDVIVLVGKKVKR